MNEMKTEEGNKLIAEFMGAKFSSEDAYGNGDVKYFAEFKPGNNPNYRIKSSGRKFLIYDLIYNESWDWLMPAFIKFKHLSFPVGSKRIPEWKHNCANVADAIIFTDTPELPFQRLTNAIKWYNQHK